MQHSLWFLMRELNVGRGLPAAELKVKERNGLVSRSRSAHYYRPQRSWGKVMFSQASVILLTGGGCLPQSMLRYHTPQSRHPSPGSRHPQSRHPPEQTPPGQTPPQEQTPPWEHTPPQEQTPPRSRHPQEQTSQSRPPWEQTPPRSRHPPGADTLPAQSMPGDMVNAGAVRILLECNLVTVHDFSSRLTELFM